MKKSQKEKQARMHYRKNKKSCLIYPEESIKHYWDFVVSITLLGCAMVIPYRVALIPEDKETMVWEVLYNVIDLVFFIDIFMIFSTAYHDQDFNLVDNRRKIAMNYIKGWFLFDLVAILPFRWILAGSSNINGVVKIARISRIYKLAKLTRLLKVLKIIKEQNRVTDYMKEYIKIGVGLERLIYFIFIFLLLCHIVACFWLMLTQIYTDTMDNWIADLGMVEPHELYITSYYFIVTTISTVGYGDIGPSNITEKIFCILNMIIGVIAFSFASGSLASILQNTDSHEAYFQEKVTVLNTIYKDFCLPLDLYSRLKQSLKYNYTQSLDDLQNFMDHLPHKLRNEVSLFIHENTYKTITFLKMRSSLFISWICPLLKPFFILEDQHIYFEYEEITNIYFLKKGRCGFVLPNYLNAKYIDIPFGEYFGVIDIVGSILQNEEGGMNNLNEWILFKHILKRQFTVMANTKCDLLSFSITDLYKMKFEFMDAYEEMFNDGFNRLHKALRVKLQAIKHCEHVLDTIELASDEEFDRNFDFGIEMMDINNIPSDQEESSESNEEILTADISNDKAAKKSKIHNKIQIIAETSSESGESQDREG